MNDIANVAYLVTLVNACTSAVVGLSVHLAYLQFFSLFFRIFNAFINDNRNRERSQTSFAAMESFRSSSDWSLEISLYFTWGEKKFCYDDADGTFHFNGAMFWRVLCHL